jgi:hypothetical protein
MTAKILTFSSDGDTTLLEYDPATADMKEVNKVIAEYEAKTGAQPFDMATGERLEKVTRELDGSVTALVLVGSLATLSPSNRHLMPTNWAFSN